MKVDLNKAVKIIRSGGVVGIPTETVYGLAADAFNLKAVEKTFSLKGRPLDNPLIVHICSMDQLKKLVIDIPEATYPIANAFWPGPLTLVLKKNPRVPDAVTGGLKTVAVRMPDHSLTLELIRQTGPLTAPSGNRSGKPSPTRADHLYQDYKGELPVLDGDTCTIGLESTVLDLTLTPPVILRPGAIDPADIFNKTAIQVTQFNPEKQGSKKSPGTRYTHYKPNAKVEWMKTVPLNFLPDTYYIFHSIHPDVEKENVIRYHGNFEKLGQNLYDHFRTADHLSYNKIQIEPLPVADKKNLVNALSDRITKAIG